MFGRPSIAILGGILSLALLALLFAVIAALPIDGKQMGYVGLAYFVFPAAAFILVIGVFGSTAALLIAVRQRSGVLWASACLALNAAPLLRFLWAVT